MSPSKELAQAKVDGLLQELASAVERIEGKFFRPMQKSAFLCSAKCCDTSKSQPELQQCCAGCEQGVHAAQALVNGEVQAFQQRLQRCTVRCQDAAQERMSPGAGEKQLAKIEASMFDCYVACASDYSGKVGKLEKDLAAQLNQFK